MGLQNSALGRMVKGFHGYWSVYSYLSMDYPCNFVLKSIMLYSAACIVFRANFLYTPKNFTF